MIFKLVNLKDFLSDESKIEIFRDSLDAHRKGLHFIIIPLDEFESIKTDFEKIKKDFGEIFLNLLLNLRSNANETKSLIANHTEYITIDFNTTSMTNIEEKIISYKDINIGSNYLSNKSHLICENLIDSKIYIKLAKILKNKDFHIFSNLNISIDGDNNGGGATTYQTLEGKVTNYYLSLCIMDSDRKGKTTKLIPDSSAEKVYNKTNEIKEKYPNIFFKIIIMDEHEIENLISMEIIKFLLDNGYFRNSSKEKELLHKLHKNWGVILSYYNNYLEYFKFIDFKKGFKYPTDIDDELKKLDKRIRDLEKQIEDNKKNICSKTRQLNPQNPKAEEAREAIANLKNETEKKESKHNTLCNIKTDYENFWNIFKQGNPNTIELCPDFSTDLLTFFDNALCSDNNALLMLLHQNKTDWKKYAQQVMYFGLSAHQNSGVS